MEAEFLKVKDLLDDEIRLFEEEYQNFYKEGESKPIDIGKPFFLENENPVAGVLLIHGLMAAPEEMRPWAEYLHSKNFSVYAMRISGHGTSPYDLNVKKLKDWTESVDRGYKILSRSCENIVIGGFSAGAGLALYHSILNPESYNAVISVSAPLQFKSSSFNFAEIVYFWNILMGKLGLNFLTKNYVKNKPDNPNINYLKCPVKSIVTLRTLMTKVYEKLPEIKIPAIIMQAKHDPLLARNNSVIIYNRMNQNSTFFKEIESFKHGIVRDETGLEVFTEVCKFLNLVYLKKRNCDLQQKMK